MPAVITCPKCKTKFKLPDKMIGKAIKCSSCGTAFKTKAPAGKSPAAESSQPESSQPSTAELAKLGLDGPLRQQPDVFAGAAPINRKSPDLLGNLAADPGFGEAAAVQGEAPRKERPADDLSEIFENPYLSPSAGKGGSRKFAGDSNYQYRPLKLWAVLVSIGVALSCLLKYGMTAVLFFLLPSVEALDEAANEEVAAEALFYGAMLLGLVLSWFAVYIFTAVMVCMFMVQGNKNVRAIGASELSISPGWSAGWWFIPIANLVKPCQSMSEIYRASIKPRGATWKKISTPTSVGVWWTFWLLANVLGSIEGREQAIDLLGETGYAALVWGSSTCLLFSGAMLIMIVFGIAKKQSEQAA